MLCKGGSPTQDAAAARHDVSSSSVALTVSLIQSMELQADRRPQGVRRRRQAPDPGERLLRQARRPKERRRLSGTDDAVTVCASKF